MKFNVQKSILIDAPLDKVRGLVENFNDWERWSPWTVLEPACMVDVNGSSAEPGHSMSWDGRVIGAGKNTLKTWRIDRIDYDLQFFKPWKSKASIVFMFTELGLQTRVTWIMNSSMPFFMYFKIEAMKNWIGMDYDRGLRMLKEVAEKGAVNCETVDNGIVDYSGFSYVGIQRTVSFSDMAVTMEQDFEKIANDIVVQAGKAPLQWVTIYPKFDMKKMICSYIAAVSDEDLEGIKLDSSYIRGSIEDGKVLEITHRGAYDFIGNAWSMGMMNLRAKKMKQRTHPFEQYWNSPKEESSDQLRSSVFFPIK